MHQITGGGMKDISQQVTPTGCMHCGLRANTVRFCVVRGAKTGHQLAGDNSSWCSEFESRTTH